MEQKKIYPYLIDNTKMTGYYEKLLEEKYKVKIFEKKNNEEIYKYYLPVIRDYMFWTFNLSKKDEFEKLANSIKAAVCGNYECNIFEKNESVVVCFNTGVCFAITDDEKNVSEIEKYEAKQKMQEINLREDEVYNIDKSLGIKSKKGDENKELAPEIYAYILQLYKMIYLNKLQKAIQNPEKFDKARNAFVKFTQEVYNVRITDSKEGIELCNKLDDELDLDERYIRVENEFDLLYKNSKLNDSKTLLIFAIGLSIVVIIIGIINSFINLM